MTRRNLLYAQAGGVTAVINASAAGVIRAARSSGRIERVLAARHGIVGVLAEDLIDISDLDDAEVSRLSHTPGGAFGSCRRDLDDESSNPGQYDLLFRIFAAHDIGWFVYNGGNGSMDVVARLGRAAERRRDPVVVVGVPKTIDNDLEGTDCCPGFGSAAKYLATAMREVALDLKAMNTGKARVFLMEVMGRNAGWLAASTALAARDADDAPHLILFPEVHFDEARFVAALTTTLSRLGWCAVTVAEGLRRPDGSLFAARDHDAFGHMQLGGAAQCIARLVHDELGLVYHAAVPDYLQRSAGHLLSATDHAQATACGEAAVAAALSGEQAVMPVIMREADSPYQWSVRTIPTAAIANLERRLPAEFIRDDGMGITEAARRYLEPLIDGQCSPPYERGLPAYFNLDLPPLKRKVLG